MLLKHRHVSNINLETNTRIFIRSETQVWEIAVVQNLQIVKDSPSAGESQITIDYVTLESGEPGVYQAQYNEKDLTKTKKYQSNAAKPTDGGGNGIGTHEEYYGILPPLCNPPILEGIDDLTTLTHLSEASVLHNLKVRYTVNNLIYTYSGLVLVAINPFIGRQPQSQPQSQSQSQSQAFTTPMTKKKPMLELDQSDSQLLSQWYSQDTQDAYSGRILGELEPHLFAIAEDAYQGLVRDGKNQSIIVSGESGAGKTVSAKHIMRYFASTTAKVTSPTTGTGDASTNSSDTLLTKAMAKNNKNKNNGSGMDVQEAIDEYMENISEIEAKILATNPILESFGNAKTIKNDNSSRFGKYLQIEFDPQNKQQPFKIVGAKIKTYLLERSRIVYQPKRERNFHIFYQVVKGYNQFLKRHPKLRQKTMYSLHEEKDQENNAVDGVESDVENENSFDQEIDLNIRPDWTEYNYINQGGVATKSGEIAGVDDAAEFLNTCSALEAVGIDANGQYEIFRIISALLHLGNVEIEQVGRGGARIRDGDEWFSKAVELLGVEKAEFQRWMTKKLMVMRFIGVLDIYGFEQFEVNSFEQFCINYANEKLQQHFNKHVFKLEQEEYQREQLANWTFIEFNDNQLCIELIEGRLGVLSILDEESRLPNGSDTKMLDKLYSNFAAGETSGAESRSSVTLNASNSGFKIRTKPNDYFEKPRFQKPEFTIKHYALDVSYNAIGFLEKNRDTVTEEMLKVLDQTSYGFLKTLVSIPYDEQQVSTPTSATSTTASRSSVGRNVKDTAPMLASSKFGLKNKTTLGSAFKKSLGELMTTIAGTETHYIRCIKPNDNKEAWQFDAQLVLAQLRACGVLETIRISCAGYPSRVTINDFIARYEMLANTHYTSDMQLREYVTQTVSTLIKDPNKFQIGLSKVFFRAGVLAQLENKRTEKLMRCATLIQKHVRRLITRKLYLRKRTAALTIQALARRYISLVEYNQRKHDRAVELIQWLARHFLARSLLTSRRDVRVQLVACCRGFLARTELRNRRQLHAAVKIQSVVKMYLARKEYLHTIHSILRLQAIRRMVVSKEIVRQAKIAKRQSQEDIEEQIKEASYKLEAKVIELTRTLQVQESKYASLLKDFNAVQAELSKNTARIDQLEQTNSENSAEIDSLSLQLKDTSSQLATTRQELESNSTELAARDDNIKNLQTEIDQLTTKLEEQSKALAASEAAAATATAAAAAAAASAKETSLPQPDEETMDLEPRRMTRKGSRAASISSSFLATANALDAKRLQEANKKWDTINSFSKSGYDYPTTNTESEQQQALQQAHPDGNYPFDEYQLQPGLILDENSVFSMLDTDDGLITEILEELIGGLIVPVPSLDNEYSPPEILFPAHLIGLCVIKMFQFNLAKRIDKLLLGCIGLIQKRTMNFDNDFTAAFWLSNVFELLSIVKTSMTERQAAGFEYVESERAMTEGMQFLESLLSDIYFGWAKDLQRRFVKLVIPAVVESEALPGFTANDNSFFNRIIGSVNRDSPIKIENILNFFTNVWKIMEFYYVDTAIMKQIMSEFLCTIGITAFNNIIMRRNFCSWKRGMQIQYNLTRIEEWCKAHHVSDTTKNLDRLLQLVKLLQLPKSTEQDVEIMFDVCNLLNPAQIKKLLTIYTVSDYEDPILTQKIIPELNKRLASTHPSTLGSIPLSPSAPPVGTNVLLDTNDMNDQVLYLTARKVAVIETLIPTEKKLFRLRALVDSQTDGLV
ncbi:Myosin-2 [Zancudomyces culisetae]|uniref:Myosin-2 n=1 Tax=Zancudomyces culisetae TaxID=1213189 RepID=A0A1R1PYV5_ZANCU|nr:Myosin-2 [Zancudomyces culisetae]|eukprot:OMH86142.1 Myosin-2 [Zancudomyces culisetae]